MGKPKQRPEAWWLIVLVLVCAGSVAPAADDTSTPSRDTSTPSPADLPVLEGLVLEGPESDAAILRDTAERDPSALGPLSIGTPDAGLLLNPVLFPEGSYWTLREPGEAWATDETIDFIVNAIEAVEARGLDPVHGAVVAERVQAGSLGGPHQ